MADIEKKIRIIYTVDGAERVATSLAELRKGAADIRRSFADATDTAQLQKYGAELNNVKDKMNELTATGRGWASGSAKGASNVAQAFQSMNYVVRDSPYFFKNFALGVLAVGNNINPLIDSIIRAREESTKLGTTLVKEMVGFLKGPGGAIFAFSLLVTAIQAVVFATEKNNKEAKKNIDNYRDLSQSVNDYSLSLSNARQKLEEFRKAQLEEALTRLESMKKSLQMSTVGTGGGTGIYNPATGTIDKNVTPELKERLDLLTKINGMIENTQVELKILEREFSQKPNLAAYIKSVSELADKFEGLSQNQILPFIKNNKITEQQLSAVVRELNAQKSAMVALSPEADALGRKIESLNNILNPKQGRKENPLKMFQNIEPIGFSFVSPGQEKLFKESTKLIDNIKAQFERAGLPWDESARAFAFAITMNFKEPPKDFGIRPVDLPKNPMEDVIKSIEEDPIIQTYESLSQNIANVFEDNMNTAWEKIFGEANSLVEQLFQTIAMEAEKLFAEMLVKKALSGVINWLSGGIWGFVSGIFGGGASAMPPMPSSVLNNGGGRMERPINITVNNSMDGKVFESKTYRALPGMVQQLQREGYL